MKFTLSQNISHSGRVSAMYCHFQLNFYQPLILWIKQKIYSVKNQSKWPWKWAGCFFFFMYYSYVKRSKFFASESLFCTDRKWAVFFDNTATLNFALFEVQMHRFFASFYSLNGKWNPLLFKPTTPTDVQWNFSLWGSVYTERTRKQKRTVFLWCLCA